MSQRRMWIVLALLAIIILAGGVRWYLAAERSDDDAARERDTPAAVETDTTPQETTPEEEPPPVPLDDEDGDAGEQGAAETLVVTTRSEGAAGSAASAIVTALGPIGLGEGLPTIDAVTQQIGPPSSADGDPNVKDHCVGEWSEIGFTGYFYFGHPPSLRASCSEGVLVTAVLGGGWSTDRGLVVGDDFARLQELYPQAKEETVSAFFARIVGSDELYALEQGDFGGQPYTTLAAALVDEDVNALVYLSGAD